MKAVGEILVKELADGFLSRKTWMILLLCCTLIPLSTLVHQRAVSHLVAQQERARVEYARWLEEIPRRYPGFAGKIPADELEVKVFRRIPELAALGVAGAAPEVVSFTLGGKSVETDAAGESPSLALLGSIDLPFIIQLILSLVAVALTFNAICGEREAGTLKLILAHGVPRGQVMLGKLGGAALLVAVPFTLAAGLAVGLLRLSGGWAPADGSVLRLGLLLLAALLYLACFLHLGLLVSSLAARSVTALVVLLFLWAALTAVIPQGAGLMARTVYPVETTASFEQSKRLLAEQLQRQLLAELRPHADREDYEEVRREVALTYEQRLAERMVKLEAVFERQRATQGRIASILAGVSPASVFRQAAATLTGGGPAEDEHFQRRLDELESELRTTVFTGTYRDVFAGGQARGRIRLVDPRNLPELDYEPLGLPQVVREVGPSLALLGLYNALLLAAALLAFRRYDVR